MNNSIKIFFLSLITFVFLGTGSEVIGQTKKTNAAFDSAKAIKEITAQIKLYIDALRKSDSTALGNLYTEDARILNNDGPSTIGMENIIHFYGEVIRDSLTGSGFITTGVWGDNDLVVEEGTGYFSLSNGKVVSKGRYLLVWKRENGVLKIFRDTFFSDGKIKN
jgi:ketosteroid isomerase-like protein